MAKGGHQHPDYDYEEPSDLFTKWTGFGDAIIGFIGNFYWIGNLYDFANGQKGKDDIFNLSYEAVYVAIGLAVLTGVAPSLAHMKLNNTFQKLRKKGDSNSEETPLRLDEQMIDELKKIKLQIDPDTSLKLWQKCVLPPDFFSHAGEYSGPFMIVWDEFTKKMEDLPPISDTVALIVATIIGLLMAWANTRTCKNNFLVRNQQEKELEKFKLFAKLPGKEGSINHKHGVNVDEEKKQERKWCTIM